MKLEKRLVELADEVNKESDKKCVAITLFILSAIGNILQFVSISTIGNILLCLFLSIGGFALIFAFVRLFFYKNYWVGQK